MEFHIASSLINAIAFPITRCAEILTGQPDGHFILRHRGDDAAKDYVMSVNFKGKPTHHLVTPNEEGHLTVNKKVFSASSRPDALITALAGTTLPKGWPVRLKAYTPTSASGIATVPAATTSASEAATTPPSRPSLADDAPTATSATAVGGSDGGDDSQPAWLHGRMSNEAAAALIPEGSADGTFFLRSRDEGEYVQSILSIHVA